MKRNLISNLLVAFLFCAPTLLAGEPITLKLSDARQSEGNEEHFGTRDGDGALFFYSNVTCEWKVTIKAAGEYALSVNASCDSSSSGYATFKVTVDGKTVGKEVEMKSESAKDYSAIVKLKEGDNKIGIGFTNDEYKAGEYDRNLFLHSVSLRKK